MKRLRSWWRGLRYRDCKNCGDAFRRFPCTLPSLVGFSFCSIECEKQTWVRWVKGEVE